MTTSEFQVRALTYFTAALAALMPLTIPDRLAAQSVVDPSMVDNNLTVRRVLSGLTTPAAMAFYSDTGFFVVEKNTGRVQQVVNGQAVATVLDLAVNNASERGLLGIAVHPNFETNQWVYLYWTCRAAPPLGDPFTPLARECPDPPQEGLDSDQILAVPLLGNRVDRFVWDGTKLTFDRNIISLRSFQNDAAPNPPNQNDATQNPAGNHNGGVLRFGADGKLYVIMGDNGRRGKLQNLRDGPTPPPSDDDQFGGPFPDDAHLTGMILRLNDDGTAPTDNPFYGYGATQFGEEGENIQKIFAYGVRNSFGMAFDPVSGFLWNQENGDDTFDEINRIPAGMNSGWVQLMGPAARIYEFKSIEINRAPSSLQQMRWPPTRIAEAPVEALNRMYMIPGAQYRDPEFSWRYAVAPAAIGFVSGDALGADYAGDLIVAASRPTLEGGYLFRFRLSPDRQSLVLNGFGLNDKVADNFDKFDISESETLLWGRNFGVGTDIQTGPNGNLYVVSLSHGAIYEISRASNGPVQ